MGSIAEIGIDDDWSFWLPPRAGLHPPLVSIGRVCIMNSMPTSLLKTKLFIPPTRPGHISRPRLIERLNAGLHGKLTLLSAPAGFGKTTLLSEWAAHCRRPVAWLSLDEGDNDPARFLAYLVAALQPLQEGLGASILAALRSPAPSVSEHLLIELINEIAAMQSLGGILRHHVHSDGRALAHGGCFKRSPARAPIRRPGCGR